MLGLLRVRFCTALSFYRVEVTLKAGGCTSQLVKGCVGGEGWRVADISMASSWL